MVKKILFFLLISTVAIIPLVFFNVHKKVALADDQCQVLTACWSKDGVRCGVSSILQGEKVYMIATGTLCEGYNTSFMGYEEGFVFKSQVTSSNAIMKNNKAVAFWIIPAKEGGLWSGLKQEAFGDKYKFVFYASSGEGKKLSDTLTVSTGYEQQKKELDQQASEKSGDASGGGTGGGGGGTSTTTKYSFNLENPIGAESFQDLVNIIGKWIFNLAIPIAVIIIIYAGVLMLTAGGNPTKFQEGAQALWYAVIGLAVVLIGKGFVTLVQSILSLKK